MSSNIDALQAGSETDALVAEKVFSKSVPSRQQVEAYALSEWKERGYVLSAIAEARAILSTYLPGAPLGWDDSVKVWYDMNGFGYQLCGLPPYSTDDATAMGVFDKIPGDHVELTRIGWEEWDRRYFVSNDHGLSGSHGPTKALAICRAAVKTVVK